MVASKPQFPHWEHGKVFWGHNQGYAEGTGVRGMLRASAACAGSGDTELWLAPGRGLRYPAQQTQCLEWRAELSQGEARPLPL